jgi:hypothetical protein
MHWRAAVMQTIRKTAPDSMLDTPRASYPGPLSTRHAPASVPIGYGPGCLANEPRVLQAFLRH